MISFLIFCFDRKNKDSAVNHRFMTKQKIGSRTFFEGSLKANINRLLCDRFTSPSVPVLVNLFLRRPKYQT